MYLILFIIYIYIYCGVTSPINRIYPLWGASPSWFIGSSPSVGRTNQGLDLVVVIASPISVRLPSHIWFISFWSNHMCTTTTHPLWGASPSRFIGSSPSVGRTNQGLDLVVVIASPTSARVPSHIWFISFWSDHMCTTLAITTTRSSPWLVLPTLGDEPINREGLAPQSG